MAVLPAVLTARTLWLSPHKVVFLFLAALLVVLASCRPREPAPAEITAITAEIVEGARRASRGAADVRIFPSPGVARGSRGGGKGEAGGPAEERILVILRDTVSLAAIETEWQRVARAHGLELLKNTTNPRLVRFLCRAGGRPTHSMQVLVLSARGGGSETGGAPRLAIILDDLGYDPSAAERFFALPFPLTAAVLPHLPHSAQVAEEANRRGFQVLLHIPMESENGENASESVELRVGMKAEEMNRVLDAMLATVPHAAGVNNHQGSRATADPGLMRLLVRGLRARRLFLIDSRTSTSTVAYETARGAGLPAAYRTVFLDDAAEPAAILEQLELAERQAREQGWAVAIGHPYSVTLEVLADALPEIAARGVELVFASDVLQK